MLEPSQYRVRRGARFHQEAAVGLRTPARRARLALVLATTALFLASWIVLPPPTYLLLLLAVGAPELSVWLLGLAVLAGGTALPDLRRAPAARIAVGFALLAVVLASVPLF